MTQKMDLTGVPKDVASLLESSSLLEQQKLLKAAECNRILDSRNEFICKEIH